MTLLSVVLKEKCIRLMREKLTVFTYRQYIDGIVIKCSFKNILCYEIEVGIYEKFAKM